ncbi:MAG: alpha/beta hydrolase family protein, partial [Thermoanaerobaculia bacterium]
DSIVLRRCHGIEEFRACVALQKEVWNFTDAELVPLRMFVVADKVGGHTRDYEAELGKPWEHPEAYIKLSSPFLHADHIVTPTLFLGGQNDFNVPLLNSEQMYQALRSLGRPTELVIYPGQFHGITKPSYVKDRYERYLAWYAKYLK